MARTLEHIDRHRTTRLGSMTGPSSFYRSRFPTSRLPFFILMLGLLVSPLAAVGALQPAPAAAQEAPGVGAGESIFNSSAGPALTVPQWSDDSGWDNPAYFTTIQLADLDGDGADELLARGAAGMIVERWDKSLGIWKTVGTSGLLSDAGGWDQPEYYETIQTADVDGDGAAELLVRSSLGLDTFKWKWDATSQTGTWELLRANSPNLSDSNGWNKPEYYLTLQTADIDGDGAAELVVRGQEGLATFKWDKNNTRWLAFPPGPSPYPLADQDGWNKPEYYLTIQMADIDGDGSAELLARGRDGITTLDWIASVWKAIDWGSPAWTDAAGWNKPEYYWTIQAADIDGDGSAEVLARSSKGMDAYSWTGGGWKQVSISNPNWPDDPWSYQGYYQTIQTADIDGDGSAELLARSPEGIESYKWGSGTWNQLASANPKLSDDYWGRLHYWTIQIGDIDGDKAADLVARGIYGIRTWSYNKVTANAWDYPVAYGFTPFTGDQTTAYNYVNTFLTIAPGKTIREQYATDANTLANYQECLNTGAQWNDWTSLPAQTCEKFGASMPITPPSGLTLAGWNTVAKEIWEELGLAQSVTDYFNDLLTLYSSIFSDDRNILDSTAATLFDEDMSDKQVNAIYKELYLGFFALSQLGGNIAATVGAGLAVLISVAMDAAGGDTFTGTLADAQTKYTELNEKNKDQFTQTRNFVVGDQGLLTYVAGQKTSGRWNPSDPWVTRYLTSEGRKNFALWIYQTLAPSVWKLGVFYWFFDSECVPVDNVNYLYFVNDNEHQDCYRGIGQDVISGAWAPDKQLRAILDPVSSDCTPTMSNTASWEFGSCSLGVAREDFFLNHAGWNFRIETFCRGCAPPGPLAIDVEVGDPDNVIDLNDPGSVEVAILGNADYDAQTTIIDSLEFAGAAPVGWWVDDGAWDSSRVKDVNGDGYLDVVATFAIADLQLSAADTTAVLRGSSDMTRFTLEAPVTVLPAR